MLRDFFLIDTRVHAIKEIHESITGNSVNLISKALMKMNTRFVVHLRRRSLSCNSGQTYFKWSTFLLNDIVYHGCFGINYYVSSVALSLFHFLDFFFSLKQRNILFQGSALPPGSLARLFLHQCVQTLRCQRSSSPWNPVISLHWIFIDVLIEEPIQAELACSDPQSGCFAVGLFLASSVFRFRISQWGYPLMIRLSIDYYDN